MAVANSLVEKPQDVKFPSTGNIVGYLAGTGVKNQIKQVAGKKAETFTASLISAVQTTPALSECTNVSLVTAALLGNSLDLPPSPQLGYCYFVPFRKTMRYLDENGKEQKYEYKEAQFQMGYKGYIQLAIRTGQYKKIVVLAIKEGELIRFDPLNEDIEINLIDDPDEREAAPTIGYYAMFELTNGFRKAMYWSKKKMEHHADQYSQAFSLKAYRELQAGKIPQKDMWRYSSFWYKNFDSMGLKTMIRRILGTWGYMSVEMVRAYEADTEEIPKVGSTNDGVFEGTATVVEPVKEEEQKTVEVEQPPVQQEESSEDDINAILFG